MTGFYVYIDESGDEGYRHQDHYWGYGLKFWPREADHLLSQCPELAWMEGAGYGQ